MGVNLLLNIGQLFLSRLTKSEKTDIIVMLQILGVHLWDCKKSFSDSLYGEYICAI